MATTPNEFLEFAKEMGLGQIQPTSVTLPSLPNDNNNNGCTLTGLSAFSNLCHLIEDIHKLKTENEHLRGHLELINRTEKFLLKAEENDNRAENKAMPSTIFINDREGEFDEDKSSTVSPSNSLKIKKKNGSSNQSLSNRERHGYDCAHHQEDLSSMLNIDHNLGVHTLKNWNRVRHAFTFSLRRKTNSPPSPLLAHVDQTIPVISISNESDDYHSQHPAKKKTIKDKRRGPFGDDTDQDDEYLEFKRVHNKRDLYRNDITNSPSRERQESSTSSLLNRLSTAQEDDNLIRRKPSKIAHYRRKLRSKLDTVKKQFSDPVQSSSSRSLTRPQISTFDEIGSGLNHALLTAKLAPAMTKSYQQKMRDWHNMQKSNFLVDYRRQSVMNKLELNNNNTNSQRGSIISTIHESSNEPTSLSPDELVPQIQTNLLSLDPILSPNQRSFLVHQWREIMSEEISLRRYHEYLKAKITQLKELETELKSLKTSIFCATNQDHLAKHHSMSSIEQCDQYNTQRYLPERCRSFQTLVSMPHSWILAVQSAAYSDILDGASRKTTEQAIVFNKKFFHQLTHFKGDRQQFEQGTIIDLQSMSHSQTNALYKENLNEKQRSILQHKRMILSRGCLRKLSLILPGEIHQSSVSTPMTPLETTITKLGSSSPIDLLSTPTNSEPERSSLPSSSSAALNKRSKRSRFDLKKTIQRSKSMCITQFNSWLQRHRQHQQQQHVSPKPRRKSAVDSKPTKEILSTPSTPKLLGSPRLARLHQRIFKQNTSHSPPPSSPVSLELQSVSLPRLTEVHVPSPEPVDDSDEQFQQQHEPQVRIYLPARTPSIIRRVRITDNPTIADSNFKPPPMEKISSPIVTRRHLQSAMKQGTTKEQQSTCTDL
ncbi:unnamed protein product [Rotaria socialis]|uniref:Uncharacterized protein n=6 Tax=Rotaria socialis TaxID=392032 RepID=A0A817UJA2_9BILA|nr:unnamed protein product [Rotaria socialis]CAF4810955.1 unnamed protein product [Rotaria socialis]